MASTCLQNLRNAIRNHCIPKGATVLTDGGPENQGGVSEFLAQPEVKIIQHIAMKDTPFSNSLVEAVNKILKYRYLHPERPQDIESLSDMVAFAVGDYNNRPHDKLGGLTPIQCLDGKQVNPLNRKLALHEARQMRLTANTTIDCQSCQDE